MPINRFNPGAGRQGSFGRFQWVLQGVVARSSQPGYAGQDAPHGMSDADVGILTGNNIQTVISANAEDLNQQSRDRLAAAGISFHRFSVEDFHAHSIRQLEEASRLIRTHPAALVYCGAGIGRTGTLVAGWAITSRQTGFDRNADDLRAAFGVEMDDQVNVLMRL